MLQKLIRPIVQDFTPYLWELSTAEVARRYNLPVSEVVRFDTNTNPFMPFDFSERLAEYGAAIPRVNEYGDASYTALREGLAGYHNCQPEQVVVGAGADELIDMVAKLFLDKGERAVTAGPTYPVYALATELMGAEMLYVARGPAPDFTVDFEQLAELTINRQAKLVWLCNPNNPTATAEPIAEIERLLQRLDGRAAVAIDEAYSEFWKQSALSLVSRYPNLLIIRTFSKAFSLAGGRIGCVVAQAETADYLNRVRPPNSVANLSVVLAQRALQADAIAEMRRRVDIILDEKVKFGAALAECCEAVYPSVANFVLARIGTPEQVNKVAEALLEKGLVVRRPGTMPGHFRLTVRLPEENARLLDVLRQL